LNYESQEVIVKSKVVLKTYPAGRVNSTKFITSPNVFFNPMSLGSFGDIISIQ
jgi:glutaredoxin